MATRRRPHDPAKAAQAQLERKQRDAEAQRLESQGAIVRRDRGGQIISAWRSNVFTLLLQRGSIDAGQHDAYERLKELWCAWKGLEGKRDGADEFVDCKGSPAEGRALVTDRMLRAGRDVLWIMGQIRPQSVKLLCAFMVAVVEEDRAMHWRGVVQRVTGETVRDKQTALVVASLDELMGVLQGSQKAAA